MKKVKLSPEELEQMSHTDVASIVLKENGKKMTIQELFQEVIRIMDLPSSYFESKIGDFFGLLSTDKRFIMLEKGFWDLKDNHSTKVVIEEEEDEEIVAEGLEEPLEIEENEDDISYDDTVDDDDDDDDLKDLVIMDDSESEDMM